MSINSGHEPRTLAEQICDGEAINWPQPSSASAMRTQSAMQLLDRIARTCREPLNPDALVPVKESWGTLQLLGAIGAGEYGDVYRAFDPMLKREVALKLSHARGGQARQWLGEARKLSRVNHANVVSIHGAEIHDGRAGIWFELIDGQDLNQWITQQGPLGAGELIALGQSLCSALAAVHAAGLIHGDIKPANVLREKGGRIVLLDFGSARDSGATELLSGSPAYLAPELLEGGPPSTTTDVYALGKTLKFLLAGKSAESANADKRLLDSRPDLPQGLLSCIESACSADPATRPQSAGHLSACLQASIATSAPEQKSRIRTPNHRWVVAACLVLVAMTWVGWRTLSHSPVLLNEVTLVTRDASGITQPVQAPLQVGAPLSLQFVPDREVFVYVINQDDQGNRFLLYPLTPDQNPIRSTEPVELPGLVNGQRVDWQVDSSSNEERFAVIASAARLGRLEEALADWPRAGQGASSSDRLLRGLGGLARKPGGSIQDLDKVVSPYQNRADVEIVLLRLPAE